MDGWILQGAKEVCHYSDYSSHEGGILVTPQIRRMLEILGVPATPSGVKLCCDKRSLAYSCLQLLTAAYSDYSRLQPLTAAYSRVYPDWFVPPAARPGVSGHSF